MSAQNFFGIISTGNSSGLEKKIDPYHDHFTLKMLLTNNIHGVINWLRNSANFGPTRQDGPPFRRIMSTRSWFDVYATTGLGKTEYASKMDCLVQITQLMKENFGISRLGSHKLSANTKCFDDLPNAVYFAENSFKFSKEQTEKLGILGYFLDTGNSKPPLEMLYDISNILITRPRGNVTIKSGMHIYKHYLNLYCSTGVGLTVEDAKTRSAEQMLNTLRRLCGFAPAFKLPYMGDPENDGHRMWLCLPIDDQYKIKLIKYFMESSHLISHTVQIKELAAMLKVDVKYWDSGDNFQLGVACEFGPHVTVGVGSTRMISVIRARTAMLNKLRLECGFVQYPRPFMPQDCLNSTMAKNRVKNGDGRQNVPFPNLAQQFDQQSSEVISTGPLEYTDPAASNSAQTTTTPTVLNTGEMIDIVMRDGVTMRGAFNQNVRPGLNYGPIGPIRPTHNRCVIRVTSMEDRELHVGH